METVVIKIVQLLLSLSLLIVLHEGGHFLFSKIFKVRVEKFYLFFDAWNFSLFKYPRNYELVKDDNGEYTLQISDSKAFWSASKYLVVSVK